MRAAFFTFISWRAKILKPFCLHKPGMLKKKQHPFEGMLYQDCPEIIGFAPF
jgi:hypothetical protein